MGHPFWNFSNDDSDRLRHTHLYQYAMIYLDQAVPLTVGERVKLLLMIRDWADALMGVDWNWKRERGELWQFGRAAIQAMCLMGAYYATEDYRYLMGAEWILLNTFYGLERNLPNSFISLDTGYEDEQRTKKLLYYCGNNSTENWQLSYLGEAAFHVYANTYNVAVKQYLAQLVLDITDWVVRNDVPQGDLLYDGSNGMNLTPMQCGSLSGEWGPRMIPQQALFLHLDEQFYPLVLLKVTEYDGKYFEWFLPNEKKRIHYPGPNGGDPVGPSLSVPLTFTWADLLAERYLLTGYENDLQWAQWIYRDAKYFANRSCAGDIRCLADRDKSHYGTGNIGRTRGFSWWARGGLLSGEILRCYNNQDNNSYRVGAQLTPRHQNVSIGQSAPLSIKDDPNVSYFILGAISTKPTLSLFGQPLGIAADPMTIASLAFANTKYFQNFQNILNNRGAAAASFYVPNLTFLRGLTTYFVGLTWTPARLNRLSVSNVVTVTAN